MGESQRLRPADVVQVMRLVGECRDLRAEAGRWMYHAAAGLSRLIDAKLVTVGLTPPEGYRFNRDAPLLVHAGLDRAEHRQAWQDYCAGEFQFGDPTFRRFLEIRHPNITVLREELLPDGPYRSSEHYNYWRKVVFEVDEFLFSEITTALGTSTLGFSAHREFGERRFSKREARIARLLNKEMARLVGDVLADGVDALGDLSPRLRQTLERLLLGESEKQAANALGISPHTLHTYVVALYRRFGVSSRAELLAKMLGLPPSRRW